MKKYLSILVAVMLAALSFTLTSCGDDEPDPVPGTIIDEDDNGGNNDNDDPNNPQEIEELLIGTWESVNDEVTSEYSEDGIFRFEANGNYTQVHFGTGDNGENVVEFGTWRKKGNSIYITLKDGILAGVTIEFEIVTLTENELVVTMWGYSTKCKRVPDSAIDKYL